MPVLSALALAACGDDPAAAALGKAWDEARRWQRDAVLVLIEANNFIEFDTRPGKAEAKMGPPKMVGYHFYSPSTRQGMTVWSSGGRLQANRESIPSKPYVLPLPDKHISLDEAIRVAQAGGNAIVNTAELRIFPDASGGGVPVWTIAFLPDVRTGQGEPRQVDAASGKEIVIADRLRPPEYRAPASVTLPATLASDFASLRATADAAAAQQGADFKLAWAALYVLLEADPRYRAPADGKVQFSIAEFSYVRPTQSTAWESIAIGIESTAGAALRNTAPRMGIDVLIREGPPSVMPRPLARALADPEPLLRQLGGSFQKKFAHGSVYYYIETDLDYAPGLPSVPPGVDGKALATIWLSRQGNPAPRRSTMANVPRRAEAEFFERSAPRDRWLWWTIIEHLRQMRQGRVTVRDDPFQHWKEFIFIDAETGKRSVQCAQFDPKDRSADPPLVSISCP